MYEMKKKRTVFKMLGMLAVILIAVLSCSNNAEAAKKPTYKIKGTVITLSAKNNTDITAVLDSALQAARDKASNRKRMTVIVPKGTYKINEKGLHIYSNTTLDLSSGVTLKYTGKSSHPMIMSGVNGAYKNRSDYNNSSLCKGYNGFKNITLKGGTWISKKSNKSSILRIFHAKNVTLDGVVFSGGGGVHQAEVAAINGFYVTKCTFKDFGDTSIKTSRKLEALQMDIPCTEAIYPSTYQDGTVMKNVEITECKFSKVPRGVGTHTLLNGAYFTNIKINNNTFENIAEEAIVGLNYRNCEIKNNTIKDCGGGIVFQFFKASPDSILTTVFDGKKAYKGKILHNANAVISNNDITTCYSKTCDEMQGIKVYGLNMTSSAKGRDGKKIPAGNYYISGVTVENNKITTAGYGIHITDTRNSIVRNNIITGSGVSSSDPKKDKYDGILVENYSKDVSVIGNRITNMQRNGIFVQQSSQLSTLENNQITICGKSGINFFMKSSVTNDIKNNSIQKCTLNGIFLNEQCTVSGSITTNTISDIVKNAVWIAEKSKVQKNIMSNIIKKADKGISVSISSAVSGTISGNTITSCRKDISIDETSQANVKN